MELVSPQIARRGEMAPSGGRTYVLGAGSGIPPGGTLTFGLVGLPHHSTLPRTIALMLAVWIVGWGTWATATSDTPARVDNRCFRTDTTGCSRIWCESNYNIGREELARRATPRAERSWSPSSNRFMASWLRS